MRPQGVPPGCRLVGFFLEIWSVVVSSLTDAALQSITDAALYSFREGRPITCFAAQHAGRTTHTKPLIKCGQALAPS